MIIKFIIYFVLFWLVSKFLRRLFTNRTSASKSSNRTTTNQQTSQSARNPYEQEVKSKEGEYVDFEEITDNKK